MGTRLHLKEKYSIKNQGSISSPFSFFYLVFLPFFSIKDNVKFKFGGREFILFVLKKEKRKKVAYDENMVEISYNLQESFSLLKSSC